MTPTPFKRRAPEDYSLSADFPMFQWWPWPVVPVASGFGLDYPSDGVLPPREVLDWLSVAEWRFEASFDDYFGNTAQTVDQLVQPGSRYVKTYSMGSPETQGRPSTSLIGNMQLGYISSPSPADSVTEHMAGIEMSWRETIDDLRYTYGFIIGLRFPGYVYSGSNHYWSINPLCRFSMEVANADGSSPVTNTFDYVNFLGDDYNGSITPAPPANWITLSRVTIGSML